MEWMDRYRRIGGWIWVVAGIIMQVVGLVAGWARPGPVTWILIGDIVAFAAILLLSPGGRTARVAGRATAVLLALDLAGAVLDRFGVLGGPGSPGVSWGDWTRFTDYTTVLLHDPGSTLVSVSAVGATVVEAVIAVALGSGWQPRWTGKAVAGLFTVYLIAMTASPAHHDVIRYAVPVLIGGALLTSATTRATTNTRETVDA